MNIDEVIEFILSSKDSFENSLRIFSIYVINKSFERNELIKDEFFFRLNLWINIQRC